MVVCSRPDSVLWQVTHSTVSKSSQFKSKKIGSLFFGQIYSIEDSCVLSVSESHLILLHVWKGKILQYYTLTDKCQFYSFDRDLKTLTLLVKSESLDDVVVETFKVMNLHEIFLW